MKQTISTFFISLAIAATCLAGDPGTEQFSTPDEVIKTMYSVISGPAGERDWDLFHSLFTADARMGALHATPEGVAYAAFTPAQYRERNAPHFLQQGFYEEELHREVHRFGELVHVFSSYQYRFEEEGDVISRGINSVQLVQTGEGWKIVSLQWNSERPDNPIPTAYLPKE